MSKFSPGQRWISEAEPDLGLGLIVEADNRVVKVVFLAAGEERVYASSSAPLSRVEFRIGEVAESGEGFFFKITRTAEESGLIAYLGERTDNGEEVVVPETRLSHGMQVNQPQDRLFTNQLDRNSAFELRYETLRQRAKLEQSSVRGLMGARVDTIPHQLYIANEVANRPSPRVLLADEVGLGKTIEAGLILHHQLVTERAKRALIVVPKALVSQWVLELMRRFNLNTAIFDEERCAEAEASTGDNPFLTEQLAIVTLDFLVDYPERAQQAVDAGWDMLVVDEAHHLTWSPEEASIEYQTIEDLSHRTQGLLLLTATPEQLGVASHFARLRLLDPNRFNDLDAFIEEETRYGESVEIIDALVSGEEVSGENYAKLESLHNQLPSLTELSSPDTRQKVIEELVDRHGTGRVLFRNTRAHVKGFPERELNAYPQDSIEEQEAWLAKWLKSHKEKALIICSSKERAIKLEEQLHLREGVLCAAFHEDLSLLARDRAAAWFAEDGGAQTLICSEIGSEGRNFQFSRHLVLLDLPTNPDLLEQRIGRLDRIGQKNTIQIHVPYTPEQESLFSWYHHGLGAFEKNCPAASKILDELGSLEGVDNLVEKTQSRLAEINAELEKGRDKLLELSSFNRDQAESLKDALLETDEYDELDHYLELACEGFGIDLEHHSSHSYILQQGTNYHGGFKDIGEEGTTVTLDRQTALSKEDFKYLTWEHPLIQDAMDQVLSSSLGNASMGTIEGTPFPAGTILTECLLSVQSIAPASLQLGRYLPPQLFRIVIDNQMRYVSKHLPYNNVKGQSNGINRNTTKQVLEGQKPLITQMIEKAQGVANGALENVVAKALTNLDQGLKPELERLRYLQTVNPSVRQEEITILEEHYALAKQAIENTSIRLDGVRVLITM